MKASSGKTLKVEPLLILQIVKTQFDLLVIFLDFMVWKELKIYIAQAMGSTNLCGLDP